MYMENVYLVGRVRLGVGSVCGGSGGGVEYYG